MELQQTYPEHALLFVWNADSGWQHALMDSLRKVLRPESGSCDLCRLTYGVAGPRAAWNRFLKEWDRPVAALSIAFAAGAATALLATLSTRLACRRS